MHYKRKMPKMGTSWLLLLASMSSTPPLLQPDPQPPPELSSAENFLWKLCLKCQSLTSEKAIDDLKERFDDDPDLNSLITTLTHVNEYSTYVMGLVTTIPMISKKAKKLVKHIKIFKSSLEDETTTADDLATDGDMWLDSFKEISSSSLSSKLPYYLF